VQHIKLGDYVECFAARGRVIKTYIRGTQRGFRDRAIIRTRDGELSDVPVERCVIVRSLDERIARLREFWSAN
jgi:hypothetical protein